MKRPAPLSSPLGFRLASDVKAALEAAAAAGDRSVSRQVERYLRAALERDGFLSAGGTAKRAPTRKRPAQLAMAHGELVMAGDA
jgi:hypothetical protein